MKTKLVLVTAVASMAALVALTTPLFAQARTTAAITPAQALAAAERPGAVYLKSGATRATEPLGTTVVQIARGLTLRQAVGLDPIPAATLARLERRAGYPAGRLPAAAWAGCSTHSWLQTFGNYPWNVSITDHTTWCAKGGVVTSKSTTATQTGADLCTIGGMQYFTNVGGIGKANFDWTDQGSWSCTWAPGATRGATDWVEMHVDATGPSHYSVVTAHTDPGLGS